MNNGWHEGNSSSLLYQVVCAARGWRIERGPRRSTPPHSKRQPANPWDIALHAHYYYLSERQRLRRDVDHPADGGARVVDRGGLADVVARGRQLRRQDGRERAERLDESSRGVEWWRRRRARAHIVVVVLTTYTGCLAAPTVVSPHMADASPCALDASPWALDTHYSACVTTPPRTCVNRRTHTSPKRGAAEPGACCASTPSP